MKKSYIQVLLFFYRSLCSFQVTTYGKSWRVGNASRNETNEILTVYLVNGPALYTGDTDQDDLWSDQEENGGKVARSMTYKEFKWETILVTDRSKKRGV